MPFRLRPDQRRPAFYLASLWAIAIVFIALTALLTG